MTCLSLGETEGKTNTNLTFITKPSGDRNSFPMFHNRLLECFKGELDDIPVNFPPITLQPLEGFQFPGSGTSEQENTFFFFSFIPAPLKEVKEGEQERLEAGEREISETRGKVRQVAASGISIPHPQLVLIRRLPVEQLAFLLCIPCSGSAS